MERAHNFNPGPSTISLEILEQISKDLICYKDTGIGIAELSHRSTEFETILENTKSNLRTLLNIPENFEILFCTGGATMQFSMVPMNFLANQPGLRKSAYYLVTGIWGEKAFAESKKFGDSKVIATSKEQNYSYIPEYDVKDITDAAYLHITSNDTVEGVQVKKFPKLEDEVPLIVDASSDILSREIDFQKVSLLYAGAQKNLGIAGVTLVIIKKDLVEDVQNKSLPILLDYKTYIKNNSLYNTPPTLPIHVCNLVCQSIINKGGLQAQIKETSRKAELLYSLLDSSEFFIPHAKRQDRSSMNITFRLASKELEEKLVKEAQKKNIYGIKGHSTFGGLRVSLYNSVSYASVNFLVEFLEEFARRS